MKTDFQLLREACEREDARRERYVNPKRKLPPPWISVDDQLPKAGRYVLVHLTIHNWDDHTDKLGCYFVVAKRTRREAGEPNNLRPFQWEQFGPETHFGQDVDYWMEIPR